MAQVITPRILTLNAYLTAAPTPSQLQQSGALVSVGGTTLTPGTYQYTGQISDLTSILQPSGTGNSAELTTMGTTFYAQGNAVGTYVLELGTQTSGVEGIEALHTWIEDNPGVFYAYLVPAAWDNQSEVVGSVIITVGGTGYTAAPTVTFSAPGEGGTTATGTATIANGAVTGVTITDPGGPYSAAPTVIFSAPSSGTTATGTANLASELDILAGDYASPTSKTYFFVTTTTANVASYQSNKSVAAFVPSPTATSQEFGAAVYFYQWLVNKPGPANKLAPMSYRFAYGVTPWPASGQNASIQTILSAYGNIIYPCSEGGIAESGLWKGTFSDGSQMSWWYGIDWYQITASQDLVAYIINGSNSQPPVLYDQDGINGLETVANRDLKTGITYGCLEGGSITATSFATYTTDNPDDYKAGNYAGLGGTISGPSGFLTVTFTLDAVQFAL